MDMNDMKSDIAFDCALDNIDNSRNGEDEKRFLKENQNNQFIKDNE